MIEGFSLLRDLQANKRADERTRTADLLITSELLYQLSYVGLLRAQSIPQRTRAFTRLRFSASPVFGRAPAGSEGSRGLVTHFRHHTLDEFAQVAGFSTEVTLRPFSTVLWLQPALLAAAENEITRRCKSLPACLVCRYGQDYSMGLRGLRKGGE